MKMNFDEAVLNEDFIKIGIAATKKFKLTPDERQQCWMIGLWNSLNKYRYKKAKFTTFLYQQIYWECLRYIGDNYPENSIEQVFEGSYEFEYIDKFSNIIKGLPREIKTILRCKYVKHMTLHEIGKQFSFSHETARQRLNEGIKLLKEKFQKLEQNGV